nr:zinc finger, CCHC-type [Tanacetum cinerariifolium]GEV53379.1 zinc finger, CCHC-type [Tanacetum cinerariifolium]
MDVAAMKHMTSSFAKLDKFKRDSLEAKYMAEDASTKKFLVSKFTNYKMTYSRPVMEQYNKLLGILGRFTQQKMNMDEAIQDELTLVELGNHLHIEESLRMQDSDKPKGNNVVGPSVVNMVEHKNSSRHLKNDYKDGKVGNKANGSGKNVSVDVSTNSLMMMLHDGLTQEQLYMCVKIDTILWHARLGHVHFKRMQDMSKDGLIAAFDIDTEKLVLQEVTEEVVTQQPEPELKKDKRNRTLKDFRPKFQLYLIKGTRDERSNQHSYCFNVEDNPKTFDEAIKSYDGFKQKSGIDYFDTYAPVARISTIRLLIAMASIDNLIIHQMDMKTAFLNGDLDEERAPKQWHQKFDEVVLSNGYLLNQAMKSEFVALAAAGKEAK